jgi:hypothetical protein
VFEEFAHRDGGCPHMAGSMACEAFHLCRAAEAALAEARIPARWAHLVGWVLDWPARRRYRQQLRRWAREVRAARRERAL